MHQPKIFISATSGDLRSIRQIVKEALLTINCHPVEQTNFEPDTEPQENMISKKPTAPASSPIPTSGKNPVTVTTSSSAYSPSRNRTSP